MIVKHTKSYGHQKDYDEQGAGLNQRLELLLHTKEYLHGVPDQKEKTAAEIPFALDGEDLYKLQNALIAQFHEGVLFLDKSGNILYNNIAMARLIGVKPEKILGVKLKKILHVYPGNKLPAILRHARKGSVEEEASLITATGLLLPVIITFIPLQLDGRCIQGVIISMNAPRLHYSQLLREKRLALKKKSAALKKVREDVRVLTFISSHHLQEPLRKIRSFVSVILDKEYRTLSEEGNTYFRRMQTAAQRMQVLLTDLLAYCNTRDDDFEKKETDLDMLLKEVFSEFVEKENGKNVITDTRPLPVARVNRAQIKQLFTHLLDNAVKFCTKAGPIRISVRYKCVKGLSVSGLGTGRKYHRITFRDNGIGFDTQYNEKIFEVFHRLHGTGEYEGTGIGLAICKRVVENHGGQIISAAEKNKGACFTIYLPV